MNENKTFKEELKVTGSQLVETVKSLLHEANVRSLIIKNEKGDTLMEIPVTAASVGAIFLPVLAAIGAMAVLVTNCQIEVIKNK